MATVPQRIFAASGAILFFLTSVGLSVVVIMTVIQDNKKQDEPASSTAASKITPEEGKLKGSKLEGYTPVASIPELKTEDLIAGTGKEITSVNDTITVDYTGALAKDGTIFESSLDSGQPATFKLSGVIEGWQKGMIGAKEGTKRRLMIPSAQAYGPNGQGDIPANADLVFDITVKKVGE
jgi:peptidylprolyl isomerase